MIRYLTTDEVLDLHRWALQAFGGSPGLRDPGLFDSAVASPQASFGGVELYPTLFDKAGALAFSLVNNHAFVDGNKRAAFWAMSTFLTINGHELISDQEEGANIFLAVAAGRITREQLVEWITTHSQPRTSKNPGTAGEAGSAE